MVEYSQIPGKRVKSAAFVFVAAAAVGVAGFLLFSAGGEKKIELETRIYINTAPVESLVRLPLIGRKTARKIVEYRRNYPGKKAFNSPEDLQKIKGIGEKTAEAVAPHISFE